MNIKRNIKIISLILEFVMLLKGLETLDGRSTTFKHLINDKRWGVI